MRLNKTFDTNLVKHLELQNKDLAFDVGAYTGDSIPGIRSLGYKHIVCFEPDPKNFSTLQSNYGKDKDITLVQKAVSNTDNSIIKMYSTRNLPFLNTLSKDWITETRHKQFYRPNQFEEFDVETITLDTFTKSLGKTPSYVKIDVEGHEYQVLDGMGSFIQPELLSFEYISEKVSDNLSCIMQAHLLGFAQFTICIEEEIPRSDAIWLDYTNTGRTLISLKENDKDNNLGGNIFCK